MSSIEFSILRGEAIVFIFILLCALFFYALYARRIPIKDIFPLIDGSINDIHISGEKIEVRDNPLCK